MNFNLCSPDVEEVLVTVSLVGDGKAGFSFARVFDNPRFTQAVIAVIDDGFRKGLYLITVRVNRLKKTSNR